MKAGYTHYSLEDLDTHPEKPGSRWELSPELGIEAFNFNVAIIDPDERLSQTHFHYHHEQSELFYVAAGRCRVETESEGFDLETNEIVVFEPGESGVHVLHNPFDAPCTIVAVGWPPEDRHPVTKVETLESLLERRYGEDYQSG
ncbi:MAG: cupin domain-containing protein [Halodesulfurarchaeum sp.]